MANLPNEILEQIFELACTDDGSTGRSLSLVSTGINSISSRHKYFSLRVAGAERFAKFAAFLRDVDPPIQYLTLDYDLAQNAPGVPGLVDRPKPARFQPMSVKEIQECQSMDKSFSIIFPILAPKLKGLYIIPGDVLPELDSYTFSQLDTLYVYGSVDYISDTWTCVTFPSLKRLNLTCNGKPGIRPLYADDRHEVLFGQSNIPTLTYFGCCIHSFDSEQILAVFDLIADWIRSERTDPSMSESLGLDARHADKFLRLKVFRFRLWEDDFSSVHMFDAIKKRVEGWPENFPRVVVVDHKSVEGGVIPMDEWHYVVEGGEGFQS